MHSPSPSTTCKAPRAFSTSTADYASTVQQRRRHRDPYALAQARARKAANLSRQEILKQERAAALGDPVRGVTTPFVESFDNAEPAPLVTPANEGESVSSDASVEPYLNFFLKPSEVQEAIKRTEKLAAPSAGITEFTRTLADYTSPQTTEEQEQAKQEREETAREALRRIASLSNGSSKDRLRVNIQRCIDTFGRHHTDSSLPPKPAVAGTIAQDHPEKTPRAGPDTGSSEVQIAILTAKIKTLADFLETRGKGDKINKRNLRVLVHRRQKLLQYLRRKERGGPRWQNLIESLGLTEGTWKGEISL